MTESTEGILTNDKLKLNDVVVSRAPGGYEILIVTSAEHHPVDLVYRGEGWKLQYAVARAARLAGGKGGDLWFTDDRLATVEYLETFRVAR